MAEGGGGYLIVAAIDFGTAYSGYAFSFRHTFQEDPTKVSTNAWTAGTGSLLSLKTTTCVLFDDKKKFHSFGYEAEDKYSDLALDCKHKEWYFFKNFKMDLYEKLKLNRGFKIEDTLGRPMPAIDVFSSSIRYLKDHLFRTCQDRIPDSRQGDIRWVLTVPAIWDEAAKQFMREAAVQAGITNQQLLIALEPEAASLFCKYLPIDKFAGMSKGFTPFQTGSKYMVIDAGGGTIDITVHEVKDGGKLAEIFKANGGKWGGTYVDKAFTDFLADIVEKNIMKMFIQEQTLDYIDLLRSFEVKKRSFKGKLTEKVMFKVPVSMNEIFQREHEGKSIKDVLPDKAAYAGKVTWTGDKLRIAPDIVNSFFDKPCDQIVNHLEKIFTNHKVQEVDFILMVGGFSESLMLQEYIRDAFPDRKVLVPPESGLAVLKGAVIFGHNTKMISERKAKYTYGIQSSVDFIPGEHPENKKTHNADNESFCEDIFNIHVKVGSTIKTGEATDTEGYGVTEPDQDGMTFNVYASKKRNPRFVDDPGCILIGSLQLEVPGHGLDRGADVEFMFGETELQVRAVNQQTGTETEAKFDFLSGDGDASSDSETDDDEESDDDDDDDDCNGFEGLDQFGQDILQFLLFNADTYLIDDDDDDDSD